MKKKTHHRSRRVGSSYKTLGLAAAAGVAAVVGLGFAQTKIQTVREHWYVGPLALAAGGALLAKRMPTIAVALVAGAGIFGYMGYQANQEAQASKAQEKSPSQTSGLTDAGALRRMSIRGDSGVFESGAGSLQGSAATPLLRSQASGLMGSAANAVLRSSAAGLSQ